MSDERRIFYRKGLMGRILHHNAFANRRESEQDLQRDLLSLADVPTLNVAECRRPVALG